MISQSKNSSDFTVIGYSTDGTNRQPIVKEDIKPPIFYAHGIAYGSLTALISQENTEHDVVLFERHIETEDLQPYPISFEGEFSVGTTYIGYIWVNNKERRTLQKDNSTGYISILNEDYSSTYVGNMQNLLDLTKKGNRIELKYHYLESWEITAIREFYRNNYAEVAQG